MPRAAEAFGIREKLAPYCLNLSHEVGGPKARQFERLLGIGIDDVEYLAEALGTGVRRTPVSDVRDNSPFGVLCEVIVPVAGLREHRERLGYDSWELRHAEDHPRLVTAYVDG